VFDQLVEDSESISLVLRCGLNVDEVTATLKEEARRLIK
jgi:hypothetical protein